MIVVMNLIWRTWFSVFDSFDSSVRKLCEKTVLFAPPTENVAIIQRTEYEIKWDSNTGQLTVTLKRPNRALFTFPGMRDILKVKIAFWSFSVI